jgi:DNA adenine methylase
VPIGTKTKVVNPDENLVEVANFLSGAELAVADFEETISKARSGDLIFADPPYTTAHNQNGFVKYNQQIFSWDDQIMLKRALTAASTRGAFVLTTNADHPSLHELYRDDFEGIPLRRSSVISGRTSGRGPTTEMLFLSLPS